MSKALGAFPPAVVYLSEQLCANEAERAEARRLNEGDASPRLVTTGGNPPTTATSTASAFIDWFAFTFVPPPHASLQWSVGQLQGFLSDLQVLPTGKGWNGYQHRHELSQAMTAAPFGLLAHGGKAQRGSVHVELNAQACAVVHTWAALQAWGEHYGARITRIDLAHDDYLGDAITIERGLAWQRCGEFDANGRPATPRLIDDLGSRKGKTLYIGNRSNGKLLRIYEKGKQLGDPESMWVRVEAELRNKGRVIPWDTLAYPGYYLAGAYPCLAYLATEQRRIATNRKAATISFDASVHFARQTAGKLINVMMNRSGGNAVAVVDQLRREGVPKRLKSFAALMPAVLDESDNI